MKKLFLSFAVMATVLASCGDDDDGGQTCTTCNVESQSVEICQGENGNAFIAGTDTTINYNTYITGLGSLCN